MNTSTKTIIVVLCITFVIACFGLKYPTANKSVGVTASTAGTTFSTAKIATISGWTPSTASATTTSLYNSDSSDRIVDKTFISCNTIGTSLTYLTGTGLSLFRFTAATSSSASSYGVSNANYIAYNTIATSSPDLFVASTTIGVSDYGRVWASGSYLVFQANATNTASCLVGVSYLPL